jgi:hypothetical protein
MDLAHDRPRVEKSELGIGAKVTRNSQQILKPARGWWFFGVFL